MSIVSFRDRIIRIRLDCPDAIANARQKINKKGFPDSSCRRTSRLGQVCDSNGGSAVVSSISSVGLSPIFARNTSTFGVAAANHSHRHVKSPETAESPTDSVELSDAYRQRESLSIRARTKLKISKDGEIKAKSQAKLRYKYDFVSADGSKISVRLKANLNFKQTVEGDQYSQSLKLSAKASVKAIQRDVSSATTSL